MVFVIFKITRLFQLVFYLNMFIQDKTGTSNALLIESIPFFRLIT